MILRIRAITDTSGNSRELFLRYNEIGQHLNTWRGNSQGIEAVPQQYHKEYSGQVLTVTLSEFHFYESLLDED